MEDKPKTYYDFVFDTETVLIENGMIDDLFYLKDLKQRKLFLNSEVSQFSVHELVKHILQINREDAEIPPSERKPILLYIASRGGEVDSGYALIDAIETSRTPVYTINLGFEYSMAFLIGLAGHKRFAFPNSRFLMHDGSTFIYDSGAKAQDQMEFNKKGEARIRQYVLAKTKISAEMYDERQRTEWYMFADEAQRLGVVDHIIGKDTPVDTVI